MYIKERSSVALPGGNNLIEINMVIPRELNFKNSVSVLVIYHDSWTASHCSLHHVNDTVIVNHSDTEKVHHSHHITCRMGVTLGSRRARYGSGDVTLLTDPGSTYFRRIPAFNFKALGCIKANCQKNCRGSTMSGVRKEYLRAPSVVSVKIEKFIYMCLDSDKEE